MKIHGFLCNYNNVLNGFLRNCLVSMSRITDVIYVYDDASTEDVKPLYKEFYCVVLYGAVNAFHLELVHKQQLLGVALRGKADWIAWWDSDAVLGWHFEDRARTEHTLAQCEANGIELLHLHNLNLYRSEGWYRTDAQYNDLWHAPFWRNTGELHYKPVGRLHQKQYPLFHADPNKPVTASKFDPLVGQLLHFGFASDEEVILKYLMYKEQGQIGYPLDRLADESTLTLEEAQAEWFPTWYQRGNIEKPNLLDWDQIKQFATRRAWIEAGKPTPRLT